MLEKLDSPATVIAVKAVGKLAKDDYQNVLTPAIKALMDSTGELRAVIVVGDDFDGITPGGRGRTSRPASSTSRNGSGARSSPTRTGSSTASPSSCGRCRVT